MKVCDNSVSLSTILRYVDSDSTIAVHGINGFNNFGSVVISIIYGDGLKTNADSNIYYNCTVLGKEFELMGSLEYTYDMNNQGYANVILAIPNVITNLLGEEYFLGDLPNSVDYSQKYNHSTDIFAINQFIKKNGYIPKEFIVGFITGDGLGNEQFYENPYYYGKFDKLEKEKFGQRFLDGCICEDTLTRLIKLNDTSLEQVCLFIDTFKRFNLSTLYFEQLEQYLLSKVNKEKK